MRIYISILIVVFFNTISFAGITSIDGNLSHNSVVDLNGSTLGVKATPDYYKYDDFEDGTDTNVLDSSWDNADDTASTSAVRYSSTKLRTRSSLSAFCNMAADGNVYNSSFGPDWPQPTTQKFYLSYWRYDDIIGVDTSNYKPMRFEGAGQTLPQCYPGQATVNNIFSFQHTNASYDPPVDYLPTFPARGKWIREEYYLDAGTLLTADAYADVWFDAVKVGVLENFVGIIDSDLIDDIVIGHYWRRDTGSGLKAYIDNIIVENGSNARMRIEIGDNPVFLDCTHREFQPWSGVWGATKVTNITLKQGTFESGVTVYLFAVQEDGTAENGFPMTFSASTNPIVTLQADKEATSPTTYTGSFTVETGRTATTVVSSNGFTVTCDDGDCTDEETEAFTVSGVTVPITDVITVTDSSAETGNDSITITLPTTSASASIKDAIIKGAILK